MAFRFKKYNCVITGTFNIYVVQPRLLMQLGMLQKDAKITALQFLNQPRVRFQMEPLKSEWDVSPDKILAETTDRDVNCGADLGKVLGALRYTPIHAVGVNIEYSGPPDGLDLIIPTFPNNSDISQRTIHVAIKRNEKVFNLQAAVTDEMCLLSANVHSDLTSDDQETNIKNAIRYLEDSILVRQDVCALWKSVFSVELSDD